MLRTHRQGWVVLLAVTMVCAATTAHAGTLRAVVAGVRGLVQVRQADDQPWQPAVTGMKLDQGAEFRTGPRSAVQVTIEPGQTITLDRLGVMKLIQAVSDDEGKVVTDLGMKYGRTRYDIHSSGLSHESTIHSPSATLAVRGTRVGLEDGPLFGFHAWSTQNVGQVRDRLQRRQMTIGADSQVTEDDVSAADFLERRAAIDNQDSRSRSAEERRLHVRRPDGTHDRHDDQFDHRRPPSHDAGTNLGIQPHPFQEVDGLLSILLGWNNTPGSAVNTEGNIFDLDLFLIFPDHPDLALNQEGGTPAIMQALPGVNVVSAPFQAVSNGTSNGGDGFQFEQYLASPTFIAGGMRVGVHVKDSVVGPGNSTNNTLVSYVVMIEKQVAGGGVVQMTPPIVANIDGSINPVRVHGVNVPADGAAPTSGSQGVQVDPPAVPPVGAP